MSQQLNELLNSHGFLHLNNSSIPSVCGYGFSMVDILCLIEKELAVSTRLIDSKVTFVSKKMFNAIAVLEGKKIPSSSDEELLYKIIAGNESIEASIAKEISNLDKRSFDKAMNKLHEKHLIHICKRGRKINDSWFTYCWNTTEQIKSKLSNDFEVYDAENYISEKLISICDEKKSKNIINKIKQNDKNNNI